MPVIRSENRPPEARQRVEMVAEIVGELLGNTVSPGHSPIIFETPSEVVVVWEKWRGLSHRDRASIILEAYEQADAESAAPAFKAPEITITIGVTADEAIEMNFLPYSLTPNVSRKDVRYAEVERLMISEGAIAIGSGRELRFPSEELARQSRARLTEKTQEFMPEVRWQLGRTVGKDLEVRSNNMEVGS